MRKTTMSQKTLRSVHKEESYLVATKKLRWTAKHQPNEKLCLAYIWYFACQAQYLSVWPPHKYVPGRHFLLVTSKLTKPACQAIFLQMVKAQAFLTRKIQNVCQALRHKARSHPLMSIHWLNKSNSKYALGNTFKVSRRTPTDQFLLQTFAE